MRELSLVELELVVGGYDQGGGGGGYDYGQTTLSYDAEGNFTGDVMQSDQQAVGDYAAAQGIAQIDITVEVPIPGGGKVTGKFSISKKK